MSHSINTEASEGESNAKGNDRPTLEEYLSSIPKIYDKLRDQGMTVN